MMKQQQWVVLPYTFATKCAMARKASRPSKVFFCYLAFLSCVFFKGLNKDVDFKKLLRHMRKTFHTNGTVVEDPEFGSVIQLQGSVCEDKKTKKDYLCRLGNKCSDVLLFLTQANICTKDQIRVHNVWRFFFVKIFSNPAKNFKIQNNKPPRIL